MDMLTIFFLLCAFMAFGTAVLQARGHLAMKPVVLRRSRRRRQAPGATRQ
jgi:hypothetical protein